MIRLVLSLVLAASLWSASVWADSSLSPEPTIDMVFERLYDFEFEKSRNLARIYSERNRENPLAHASLAATYLFSEMNRLSIFNKDLLNDEKVAGTQARSVGEDAKRDFSAALVRTKQSAGAALKKDSRDANALLAMVIATGAERDFAALVEKRLKDSYYAAKESQDYALRLQAVDPSIADAWFTRGFSEYLVGSVPLVVRWMMKIDQVQGDKRKGVEFMERCARSGKFLRPFAQMMLSTIYQKEKRPAESRRMLEQFAAEHPRNLTVRLEIQKLPKS